MKDNQRYSLNTSPTYHLENTRRFVLVMMLLFFLFLLGLVLNANIGTVAIRPAEIFQMIGQCIRYGIANLFADGKYSEELAAFINRDTSSQILFRIRLPRVLLAAVLGGALSVSGYLLQVFFHNPIAGPFVLGISSGAKMVVGITLIFLTGHIGTAYSMTLITAAFTGSLLITALVLLFSQKVHNMSMLLVIGIMIGYICGAVTDFCVTFANEHDVINLTNWAMGSFSGANWNHVRTSLCVCIPGLIGAVLMSKPISAYILSESYAASMGVSIKLFRAALLLVSSLLSATVTAIAGPISFVGIAVPHITKMLLKSARPLYTIPAVFLCGSVFCIFCDLIARTLFAPVELMIGTVTSCFGAPVVIYLMIKRRRGQEE